jgi:hypothetical protein
MCTRCYASRTELRRFEAIFLEATADAHDLPGARLRALEELPPSKALKLRPRMNRY